MSDLRPVQKGPAVLFPDFCVVRMALGSGDWPGIAPNGFTPLELMVSVLQWLPPPLPRPPLCPQQRAKWGARLLTAPW